MTHHTPQARPASRLHRSTARVGRVAVVAALALMAACNRGPADATDTQGPSVDRETFIATYVDLRTAAIRARPDSLSTQARARILDDHGVTDDELLHFVQDHGQDVGYMRGVWDDVEKRLDTVRLSEDSGDIRR